MIGELLVGLKMAGALYAAVGIALVGRGIVQKTVNTLLNNQQW